MDDDRTPEHLELLEALLNLASLAAEMQVTDEGHDAVIAICDAVADHYGIARIEAEEPELPQETAEDTGAVESLAYLPHNAPRISFRGPK